MLIREHISKDFTPPKIGQTVGYAHDMVEKFGLNNIPVVDGKYISGSVSRETLEEYEPDTKLSELSEYFDYCLINEKSSLLDAVQEFNKLTANVLAVVNQENQFVGFLLLEDVIAGLSSMPLFSESGSVLIVETPLKKLSFSEISNITESNNAKLIGLFVIEYNDDNVRVAVKTITDNLTSVGETFERFDYKVIYKSFNDEKEELMKERFNQLMKYLDI